MPSAPFSSSEGRDRAGAVALPPMDSLVRGVTAVLGQGEPLVRGVTGLGSKLVRVATGSSELAPHAKDKRFADPTWTDSPVYRRVAQSYLALVAALDGLLAELEASESDWRKIERARLAHSVLTSALAPTNTLPANPAALKRAFETSGTSVLRGLRNWSRDVRHNRGMPAQVEPAPSWSDETSRSARARSCSATRSRS